jgi:hypothetical protein
VVANLDTPVLSRVFLPGNHLEVHGKGPDIS